MKLTARQRGAIEHPVVLADTAVAPHKSRVQVVRNRVTILTVSEVATSTWVWHASMSYRQPWGGGKRLADWNDKNGRKARSELTKMLEGVGDEVVLAVGPAHLDMWADFGLQDLESFAAGSATAHAAPALQLFELSQANFYGAHLWKSLTDDELAVMREHLETDA